MKRWVKTLTGIDNRFVRTGKLRDRQGRKKIDDICRAEVQVFLEDDNVSRLTGDKKNNNKEQGKKTDGYSRII